MTTQAASSLAIESVDDFFAKQGPVPQLYQDGRRFPRYYFRTCAEAIIHPVTGKEADNSAHCFLLTCDLSRAGIGLLHTAQLFPGQRIDIVLNGEPPRMIEVVWCRRTADGRYNVGCRFCTGEAQQG
jgi:hypothetical protein